MSEIIKYVKTRRYPRFTSGHRKKKTLDFLRNFSSNKRIGGVNLFSVMKKSLILMFLIVCSQFDMECEIKDICSTHHLVVVSHRERLGYFGVQYLQIKCCNDPE